jgi:hypothetical protein
MFADLARDISAEFGGPFFTGTVTTQAEVEYDAGGDVIPGSGGTLDRSCDVQIDVADYAMRQSEGYVEGQMRCIILAATLDGALDTDAAVTVDAGPHAGKTWQVSGIGRDTLGTQWLGKAVEA